MFQPLIFRGVLHGLFCGDSFFWTSICNEKCNPGNQRSDERTTETPLDRGFPTNLQWLLNLSCWIRVGCWNRVCSIYLQHIAIFLPQKSCQNWHTSFASLVHFGDQKTVFETVKDHVNCLKSVERRNGKYVYIILCFKPGILGRYFILLMAEILHHLRCMKPCRKWYIYHMNWLAGFLNHQHYVWMFIL